MGSIRSLLSDSYGGLRVRVDAALDGEEARTYDAFVEGAPSGHYAQTRAWGALLEASRPCRVRYARIFDGRALVGCALLELPGVAGVPLRPLARVERGPVTARPEDVPRVARALAAAALKRGVLQLRVMPYWSGDAASAVEQALAHEGFRDVQAPDGSHAETLRVTVAARSDEALLEGPGRKSLRQQLRLAEREGVVVEAAGAEGVATLRTLHDALMAAQDRKGKSRAYYDALAAYLHDGERRGRVFLARQGDELLAAGLVLRHGALATYVLGASTSAPRKFSKTASLLMAAMRWARESGCEVFDLGGVPPEADRDPKRNAIAKFKFEFDKTRVRLVHEHARWF
jgi:lipid II:glycine glycyltransferase (peptidoglycan interpeptide bridge formation enzyme)